MNLISAIGCAAATALLVSCDRPIFPTAAPEPATYPAPDAEPEDAEPENGDPSGDETQDEDLTTPN